MDFRGRMISSRPFMVFFITALVLFITVVMAGTVIVVRNAYLNMRLSSICPDYFSYEYAYVVDENGKGIDSVAVTLRDNSNINLIYRTFTDSTGRFVLFHDFGSFALYDMPFSYFLYVSAEGWTDTVRYSFERYRLCHFRKKEGPDTIVFNPGNRSVLSLQLERASRQFIDSGFAFSAFADVALSVRRPAAVGSSLDFDTVYYSALPVGGAQVGFAVVPIGGYTIRTGKKDLLTEGTYYLLDRNNDGSLTDETPVRFSGTDCTVGTCRAADSVMVKSRWYHLNLQLHRGKGVPPQLRYRRADAIKGYAAVDSLHYTVLLWDPYCTDYSDRSKVLFCIDRNGDGSFDSREGSSEVYENCRGTVAFDSVSMRIDTISSDGLRIFCSAIRRGVQLPSEAAVGTWTDNFSAAATCPLSLYRECAANRYVVLYFFEGMSISAMEAADISTLIMLMRDQLGAVRLIGINRHSAGELYTVEPVINENRGWDGPLVRQFHNHREREIICLDAGSTIIYRGTAGRDAITALWAHAGYDDIVAQAVFEQRVAGNVVDPGIP